MHHTGTESKPQSGNFESGAKVTLRIHRINLLQAVLACSICRDLKGALRSADHLLCSQTRYPVLVKRQWRWPIAFLIIKSMSSMGKRELLSATEVPLLNLGCLSSSHSGIGVK